MAFNAAPCGAKTRNGGICKNPAMPNGRCRMHGGKTPRGHALPQTKTGRYSKDLPTRLAARYEETANDPELLSLRQEIRLIDTLIMDNMTRLDSGESAEAWEVMRKSVDGLTDAIADEDYTKIQKGLREMRDVIDLRILHYATEMEIRSKIDQRRKLVETEQRMTMVGEQTISVEKAMLLVGAIAGILRARIHDSGTLAAIQQDIGLLLNASETAG
jgi:hypothetical protein